VGRAAVRVQLPFNVGDDSVPQPDFALVAPSSTRPSSATPRPSGEHYARITTHHAGETFPLQAFPDVSVDVSHLFGD
jgi:hypothetical protein